MKIGIEIEKVTKSNAIYVEKLSEEMAGMVKKSIAEKYVYTHLKPPFLWDKLKEPAVAQRDDGWQKLCSFIGNKRCLMFFNDIEDKSVFILKDGEDLYKLLNEMYGFEFYITDFETEYLFCFNHHDCLLGCGQAKKWVESLNE